MFSHVGQKLVEFRGSCRQDSWKIAHPDTSFARRDVGKRDVVLFARPNSDDGPKGTHVRPNKLRHRSRGQILFNATDTDVRPVLAQTSHKNSLAVPFEGSAIGADWCVPQQLAGIDPANLRNPFNRSFPPHHHIDEAGSHLKTEVCDRPAAHISRPRAKA
ncbi:hypothetical protein FHS21_005651 [Phyllobacterium trifolii]|uniref:Uncharacterized protein n=1 Tax=Phyllobacterium trifolii TaxID=300193 RepID=A0A839UL15_9HYPH|nr:hypothetical protein [Phyllobacterium trifolii]MBB3149199.1 hypothetical protein [Phyllobacterium trifolii]